MSTNVTYVGTVYRVPAYQDTGYAQGSGNLSSYLIALATGSLTLSGGTFTLTADVDFGANFGLKSIYYKSRNANISSTGIVRMGNTELIGWRDNAHANDITIGVNATQTGGAAYTIPDTGATTADFVMTKGTQASIAGAKTFVTSPLRLTLAQSATTQVVVLNSNAGTAAASSFSADNGTNSMSLTMFGTGYTGTQFAITLANYATLRSGSGAAGLMLVSGAGNVYIGASDTKAVTIDASANMTLEGTLTVKTSDVTISAAGGGVVCTTPNGAHTYRISVDNNGVLGTNQLT